MIDNYAKGVMSGEDVFTRLPKANIMKKVKIEILKPCPTYAVKIVGSIEITTDKVAKRMAAEGYARIIKPRRRKKSDGIQDK